MWVHLSALQWQGLMIQRSLGMNCPVLQQQKQQQCSSRATKMHAILLLQQNPAQLHACAQRTLHNCATAGTPTVALTLKAPLHAVVDQAWHHQRDNGHGRAVLRDQLRRAACSRGRSSRNVRGAAMSKAKQRDRVYNLSSCQCACSLPNDPFTVPPVFV